MGFGAENYVGKADLVSFEVAAIKEIVHMKGRRPNALEILGRTAGTIAIQELGEKGVDDTFVKQKGTVTQQVLVRLNYMKPQWRVARQTKL